MEYLLVGIGGAFGSITRYSIGKIISEKLNKMFPIATFIINITGAILLGVASNIGLNSSTYRLVGDGFLGAYTTFSTFMYEGFNLFDKKRKLNAFIYIISTLVFGTIGFLLGYYISRIII